MKKVFNLSLVLLLITILLRPVKAVNDLNVYQNNYSTQTKNPLAINLLVNKDYYLDRYFVPYDLIKPEVRHLIPGDIDRNLLRFEPALMLENLFFVADKHGVYFYSVSAYRSFKRQEDIFSSNVLRRGLQKANQTSARPGESEHQTGLAVDLTSAEANYRLTAEFGETEAGRWLKDNAHYFGFIIRYLEDEQKLTGYNYEPWHLRYVGIEDAVAIVDSGLTYEEYYFANYLGEQLLVNETDSSYKNHLAILYQDFKKRDLIDDKLAEEVEEESEIVKEDKDSEDETEEEEIKQDEKSQSEDNRIRISF